MTDLSHDLRISREALAAAERRADEAERAVAAQAAEFRDLLTHLLRQVDWGRVVAQGGDWACVQCRPHSDILTPGFQCAFHKAEAILSALTPIGSGWLSPEQGAEARDRETKLAKAMRDGHHALSTLIGICKLRDMPQEVTAIAEPGLEAMRSTLQALGLCEITAEFFSRVLAAHPTKEVDHG